jgi:DNA polymerase III subunit delta'
LNVGLIPTPATNFSSLKLLKEIYHRVQGSKKKVRTYNVTERIYCIKSNIIIDISMENLYEKYKAKFPAQTEAISRAAKNDKFAHAYMIYSDTEETRMGFATYMAQIAACPSLSSDGLPCNECSVCRQIAEASYAELFSLMPVSKSRSILIGDDEYDPDTMRWFQSRFYMSSVCPGKRKVGIIYDADCLNQQAQNAFLKTLEEPPSKSVFILATGNPSSLLPTIRSRCHFITLLENVCAYEFKGKEELVHALMRLQNCETPNLAVSEECAGIMVGLSRQLNDEANENVLPNWEKKLEDAANPDMQMSPAIKKRIKARYEAAVAAEYLKLRSFFLSLIHTWFAQSYQLACGVSMDNLSNPGIYQHLDIAHSIFNDERAYAGLIQAENLLGNLQWNVNEELAFREFCVSFTSAVSSNAVP